MVVRSRLSQQDLSGHEVTLSTRSIESSSCRRHCKRRNRHLQPTRLRSMLWYRLRREEHRPPERRVLQVPWRRRSDGNWTDGKRGRDGEAGWRRESSGMVNQPPQAGVSSCIPCLENTPLDSLSGPRSRPPWHPVARAPSSVAPEAVPIRYQVNTPEPPPGMDLARAAEQRALPAGASLLGKHITNPL